MTSIGNSVFYCFHKNNNVKDVIQTLHPFVFKKDAGPVVDTYQKSPETENISKVYNQPIPKTETIQSFDLFTPTQKDSLFWCLYVAMYSSGEYDAIYRNYGVKKMEVNQEIMDYLKTNTNLLKQVNHKFTKTAMVELLADLSINLQSTSLVNVYAYLCFYKFNVYIINKEKRSYLPFVFDSELPNYFIYVDGFGQYKLQTEPITASCVENLHNDFVCLEGLNKTLKSLSAYKVADLIKIAEKLKLPSEKVKKNDLYDSILETIRW